ncbi:MAG: CRTAC1 family protein [Planctomycetota bacterium]|jgi:hypothetical protein
MDRRVRECAAGMSIRITPLRSHVQMNSRRLPPRWPWLVVALAGVAWAIGTVVQRGTVAATTPSPPVPSPASPDEFVPQRPEFERIAAGLYGGTNEYLGRARIPIVQRRLSDPNLPFRDQVNLRAQLVNWLLQAGDVDGAVELVEELVVLASSRAGLPPMPNLHHLRGLVYLRQAELQNCVLRHNADCCIFPLEGGAVHVDRDPAERARESFLAYLELEPDDLKVRWLLNIVMQAHGGDSEGVPEQFVIPPGTFDSSYDIGRFRDIAPALGIDTFNLCGGAIAEDFDGDERLDIVTSTFDPEGPLTYYRQRDDGGFDDRSDASRATDQLGGLNIVGADYDNDGDMDVLVLRGAWLFDEGCIRNSLLRNDGGGTFTDVTRRAGLATPARPTQAAAWGDFDNDGDLDLYIGNESRVRSDPRGDYPGQLYRNNGDGTFIDIAKDAGVTNDRYCKGVAAGDFDNDGDLDLYLSNVGPNRLYRNDGDGTFTDVAPALAVTEPAGRSFATWFFDYDNDGWLDLFVAAYQASVADLAAEALGRSHGAALPRLYRNLGATGTIGFADVTREVGLDHVYLPMGANFGDLDHDGWLDVYLTTGDPDFQSLMPNVMLRNDEGRRFLDVTRSGGFGHLQKGHGVAFADLDNDGDQDIYHQLGGFFPGDRFHNALFLNPGHGNHFLYLRLAGTTSNRAAAGARIRVEIETPTGPRQIHRAVGAVSSFGGSPYRQEIGLGDATRIRSLHVTWPASGLSQTFTDVPMDQLLRVTEAEDTFRIVPMPESDLDSVGR